MKRNSYLYGSASSDASLKSSSAGADSQGGKMLPCSLDDLSKMVFSLVVSSRDCWGTAVDGDLGDFSCSALAMTSWHFRFSLWRSAWFVASLEAFI